MVTIIDRTTPGYVSVYEKYGEKINDFDFITKLDVDCSTRDGGHRLTITLTDRSENNGCININCMAIATSRFSLGGNGPIHISGLQISSLKDRQLEGINWEVSDFESNRLRILCRDLEISILS